MSDQILNPKGVDVTSTSAISDEVITKKEPTEAQRVQRLNASLQRRLKAKERRDEAHKKLKDEEEEEETLSSKKEVPLLNKFMRGLAIATLTIGISVASKILIRYLSSSIIGEPPKDTAEGKEKVEEQADPSVEEQAEPSVKDMVEKYEEQTESSLDVIRKKKRNH